MRLRPQDLGLFLSAAICGPAVAQTVQPPTAPGTARQWDVRLASTLEYDDNIARSDAATAAARGLEREDVLLQPRLVLNLAQPIGRGAAFLQGNAGYVFHRNNSQLDRQRLKLDGGYSYAAGSCTPTVFGGYSAAQSDLALIEGPAIQNLRRTTSVGLSLQCALPTGLGAAAVGQRSNSKNSAALQKETDVTTEVLSLAAFYGHPTLGKVQAIYNYADNEMPNRIIPGRPVGDGFWTESLGLSIERQFASRLTVSASIARTKVKREFAPEGTKAKFTGTTYSGVATYRVGRRAELAVDASRSVQPSGRIGKLYDVVTAAGVEGRYKVGPQIALTLGHRFEDADSNVDTSTPILSVTESRTRSTYGSVRYQLRSLGSIALDLREEERDTDVPALSYSSTRVGVTIEATF